MTKSILMLAAEHGGFAGAKVGGVGDVIRDLPNALNDQGCHTMVALPSYGFLTRLPNLKNHKAVNVIFYNYVHIVSIYSTEQAGHTVYIFDHPLFSNNDETVYCDDPDHAPFASDATKFALFCAAVAQSLLDQILPTPDIVHCHDWHTGFFPLLTHKHIAYKKLSNLPVVFTIHNLAMQGVRPIAGDDSSLYAWFGNSVVAFTDCIDPTYQHCINPMRAGIVLSKKVHTVSPTYAQEILEPSDPQQGIYGGEGLESDLVKRKKSNDLVGILNGCDYTIKIGRKPSKEMLCRTINSLLLKWIAQSVILKSVHYLAQLHLKQWHESKNTGVIVTSVGRLTDQKIKLLLSKTSKNEVVLDVLLNTLKGKGTFILLGSGNKNIEQALTRRMGKHANFIFLNGYDENVSNMIYKYGSLFLMPSSFEPCGISQLLAMRAGQPCLVSDVGGLKDTVIDNKTGFVFTGKDNNQKTQSLIKSFERVIDNYLNNLAGYKVIAKNAKAVRFSWEASAKDYIEKLYK